MAFFFKILCSSALKKKKNFRNRWHFINLFIYFFLEIKSKDIRSPENRIKYPLSTMSAVKIPKLD